MSKRDEMVMADHFIEEAGRHLKDAVYRTRNAGAHTLADRISKMKDEVTAMHDEINARLNDKKVG